MKKLLNIILLLTLLLTPVAVFAQEEEDVMLYGAPQEEDDLMFYSAPQEEDAVDAVPYTSDGEYDYDFNFENTTLPAGLAEALGATGIIFGGIMILFSLVVCLAFYAYFALALMKIGKHLNYENSWFAWIPILNLVMLFQLGDQNPWYLLLTLIPGVGAIIVAILTVIALMNICEKRGYDKLLGLLYLVPVGNLVLLGILAWGKQDK